MPEPEDNAEPDAEPERLVANDISEAVWLRLRRLGSATLCRRVIEARRGALSTHVLERKGREVASSVRGALGYWQSNAASLNAKVLTRYYALLQISIAEQLADPQTTQDLSAIQQHTEGGHGLWAISAPDTEFPANYMIGCNRRGHFREYCRFKGLDLGDYAIGRRPENWEEIAPKQALLVSLSDLLRRIPELQAMTQECLRQKPLSFHVWHDPGNLLRQEGPAAGRITPPLPEGMKATFVGVGPIDQGLSADYIAALNLPIRDISMMPPIGPGRPTLVGHVLHPEGSYWHQHLRTYKSGYCGTSVIVPLWGVIEDVFMLHFVTLFGLSIIVRYLPSLWSRIEDGDLDHVRALLEHYLAIIDNVLPAIAVEKITGRKLSIVHPGSMQGFV